MACKDKKQKQVVFCSANFICFLSYIHDKFNYVQKNFALLSK